MKNIIKKALDKTYDHCKRLYGDHKTVEKSISILDVNPLELKSFMEENDIPDHAEFSGKDNGYDGWNDIVLAWSVKEEMTDQEKNKLYGENFYRISQHYVPKIMRQNGYTPVVRNGLSKSVSKLLYENYMKGDFDDIAELYSIFYKKD